MKSRHKVLLTCCFCLSLILHCVFATKDTSLPKSHRGREFLGWSERPPHTFHDVLLSDTSQGSISLRNEKEYANKRYVYDPLIKQSSVSGTSGANNVPGDLSNDAPGDTSNDTPDDTSNVHEFRSSVLGHGVNVINTEARATKTQSEHVQTRHPETTTDDSFFYKYHRDVAAVEIKKVSESPSSYVDGAVEEAPVSPNSPGDHDTVFRFTRHDFSQPTHFPRGVLAGSSQDKKRGSLRRLKRQTKEKTVARLSADSFDSALQPDEVSNYSEPRTPLHSAPLPRDHASSTAHVLGSTKPTGADSPLNSSFPQGHEFRKPVEVQDTSQHDMSSTGSPGNSKNIRARKEGDMIIGALFPLHEAPNHVTAYTRQCGQIREYYGIQRVEAFLMTVDKINNDSSILPHIKLGWDIRDSCWYSAIALENSIDFIKDAIASQSNSNSNSNNHNINLNSNSNSNTDRNSRGDTRADVSDTNSNNSFVQSTSATVSLKPAQSSPNSLSSSPASGGHSQLVHSPVDHTPLTVSSTTPICRDVKHLKPIAGLVGPGSSEATIQVQNLLQIFNIPQIGYSATSMDLSDKSHYKYFLRVVPPDRYQAQAMVDLVVHFNWTYISVVHSDGNYGIKGSEKFKDLVKERGVCIATTDTVASSADDAAFDDVLSNLLEHPNATVVVCFCEGKTVMKLFLATTRKSMTGRFLIVGSDGWGNRRDVVEGQENAAIGAISFKLYSPPLPDFKAHYDNLRPFGSPHNPWLNSFWEQRFQCSLNKTSLRGYRRSCVGNESLSGSIVDSKLGFVVNAVTTMARALHNMHAHVCPGFQGLCPAMEPINGSVFLQYLLNVSFRGYSGEMVHFDSKGDPPGRYEILNYQPRQTADGNTTYEYVTIGHWMTGSLRLNRHPVYWPRGRRDSGGYGGHIRSVCSEPCRWGQAKKVKGAACCWICTTCLENEVLVDNSTDCRPCDRGMWPDFNKTDCEAIPIDFISWMDTGAVICISLAVLGTCVTGWICAIFVRHNDTPVVKASTRELSYIILAGISLAFSSNFFILAKPATGFCYLTRILPGLSFSLMYGALVTRTNRIARILEGSKRIMTKKPRFMSASAQVVITSIIIAIECAVIIGMLVYQPADSMLDYPAVRQVRLICNTSTLGIVVPLGFDLVLILLCTIYAVKTRNLPENFNEAKFIGFTMYSTCVIWMGFFPIYFAGENKEITLSISISLSAAIALLLLFLPKVYIIVRVPEKNTRGTFTTSRDVRCHIGSKSMASGESMDIKESSTLDSLCVQDKSHSKQWRQKSLDEKRLRFVMQRGGGGGGGPDSDYINHGVLPKPPGTSLVKRGGQDYSNVKDRRKESARTETAAVSAVDRDRDSNLLPPAPVPVTCVLPGPQGTRHNLAKEFPAGRRQTLHRSGSPAEREKHRIHNVSLRDVTELDRLFYLSPALPPVPPVPSVTPVTSLTSVPTPSVGFTKLARMSGEFGRMGESFEFRKSLSSNCVSCLCVTTRSVECQTGADLTHSLVPELRRRKTSRNKKKLQRSEALDAHSSKEPQVLGYCGPSRPKRCEDGISLSECGVHSLHEPSETSRLVDPQLHERPSSNLRPSTTHFDQDFLEQNLGQDNTKCPHKKFLSFTDISYESPTDFPHHHHHHECQHCYPYQTNLLDSRHSSDCPRCFNQRQNCLCGSASALLPRHAHERTSFSHSSEFPRASYDLSEWNLQEGKEGTQLSPDGHASSCSYVHSQGHRHESHVTDFPKTGVSPSCCVLSSPSDSERCSFLNPQHHHHRHHHLQHEHVTHPCDSRRTSVLHGHSPARSPAPAIYLDQESSSPGTLSTATSSSSFTLPPFTSTTDSDTSEANAVKSNREYPLNATSKQKPVVVDLADEQQHDPEDVTHSEWTPLREETGHSSPEHSYEQLLPLDFSDKERADILELQKYLQSHGVNLDISNVQTSDL